MSKQWKWNYLCVCRHYRYISLLLSMCQARTTVCRWKKVMWWKSWIVGTQTGGCVGCWTTQSSKDGFHRATWSPNPTTSWTPGRHRKCSVKTSLRSVTNNRKPSWREGNHRVSIELKYNHRILLSSVAQCHCTDIDLLQVFKRELLLAFPLLVSAMNMSDWVVNGDAVLPGVKANVWCMAGKTVWSLV